MINVYFPGDTVFLYAAFQQGLNFVNERNETIAREIGSLKNNTNGLYINGQYVSYDEYMYYYNTNYNYLIDATPYDTYYAYNSYYFGNSLGQYYNYTSPYYIRSLEDPSIQDTTNSINETNINNDLIESLDKADIIEVISHSMSIRILHDQDGEIFEDLTWTPMIKMNSNEFYYNFCIPYDFNPGQYQVIYRSIYSIKYFNNKTKQPLSDDELTQIGFNKKNKTKTAYTRESFYVVIKSDMYENVIKVFGDVRYDKTTLPAEDVRVSIFETDTETNDEHKIYQSLTDRDGKWEAYVYPNQYRFCFSRLGYIDENIYAEINDDAIQQPFQTVTISNGSTTNGTGLYRVFDEYTTKNGQPINGLTVTAYSIDNPTVPIATSETDDKGHWELYLNDGQYLLKVTGYFNSIDFSRIFRLRITINGEWFFEGLMKNILTDDNINMISQGTGSFKIEDTLQDRWNNPVSEVQINVYPSDTSDLTDANIIAQDYSDGNGTYILYLDPGTYIFEYYHPNYSTHIEIKNVDEYGNITTQTQSSSVTERSIDDSTKNWNNYSSYSELLSAINNGTLITTTNTSTNSVTNSTYTNYLYNAKYK